PAGRTHASANGTPRGAAARPSPPPSPARGRDGARGAPHASSVHASPALLTSCLAGLAPDDFALVLDALALVGLRLAQVADLRGHLAHDFLVRTLDHDLRRLRRRQLDARRCLVLDLVRIPQRQLQPERLRLGLEADARDL